jgi:hypothetical protein
VIGVRRIAALLEQQKQMVGVNGVRLEIEGFIPRSRLVILGVDKGCSNASDIPGPGRF